MSGEVTITTSTGTDAENQIAADYDVAMEHGETPRFSGTEPIIVTSTGTAAEDQAAVRYDKAVKQGESPKSRGTVYIASTTGDAESTNAAAQMYGQPLIKPARDGPEKDKEHTTEIITSADGSVATTTGSREECEQVAADLEESHQEKADIYLGRRGSRRDKRINDLIGQRYALQDENHQLREQIHQLQEGQQQPQQPQGFRRPDSSDPKYQGRPVEEFAEDLANFKVIEREMLRAQAEQERYVRTIFDEYNANVNVARTKYRNFDEVVGQDVQVPIIAMNAMYEMENGPEVAYYLREHPEVRQQLLDWNKPGTKGGVRCMHAELDRISRELQEPATAMNKSARIQTPVARTDPAAGRHVCGYQLNQRRPQHYGLPNLQALVRQKPWRALMAYIDGQRLIKAISELPGHAAGYLMKAEMITAIQRASSPEGGGIEYPKAVYLGSWDSYKSKDVANSAEEQSALAAGWSTAPAPAEPSRFPYRRAEKICPSNPGGKTTIIHNLVEEQRYEDATDPNDWMADSLRGMYGGVPTSVDQIVQEYAAALHKQLDEEFAAGGPEVLPAEESASVASSDTVGDERSSASSADSSAITQPLCQGKE